MVESRPRKREAEPQAMALRLRELLGNERLIADPARLATYECDGLTQIKAPPILVTLPETTEEVADIVRICCEEGVPILARGAGTCLSGGPTPEGEAVMVQLSRMRRILRIDPEARLAEVQPGVVNVDLAAAARPHGLTYAPDPSSQTVCTIGGNVAENSGGPHCLKHGATSNHILALEVVLSSGEVVELEAPLPDEDALDLRGVVLGSEGTLGIVTRITCRLMPIPACIETLLAPFPTLEDACRAVGRIVSAGLRPAALEALDDRTIAAVEASVFSAGYPRDAGAVLLAELDGHPEEVASDAERLRAILEACGALEVQSARDPEHRRRLWRGRKGAFGAMGRLAPDLYVQDAVVPRSKLPEVIRAIGAVCDELNLRLANVFHAGDGNLHPNISYDGRDPEEVSRVLEAGRRIMRICIDAGGTLSGEHGIGLEKREFMSLLFSPDDLESMRRLRRAFDPDDLMNPGKILPAPGGCAEGRSPASRP